MITTSLCHYGRSSISSISISRKWVDVEAESETRLIIMLPKHHLPPSITSADNNVVIKIEY